MPYYSVKLRLPYDDRLHHIALRASSSRNAFKLISAKYNNELICCISRIRK